MKPKYKHRWPKHIPYSSDVWTQVADLLESCTNSSSFICNIIKHVLNAGYAPIDCLIPIAQERFGAYAELSPRGSWWSMLDTESRIKFCRAVAKIQKRRGL